MTGRNEAESATTHFLRLHAAHLEYIGQDSTASLRGAGAGGASAGVPTPRRQAGAVELHDRFFHRLEELRQPVRPSATWKPGVRRYSVAAAGAQERLGSEEGFGHMASHFAHNLFTEVPQLNLPASDT
jgi:hypothetical protein